MVRLVSAIVTARLLSTNIELRPVFAILAVGRGQITDLATCAELLQDSPHNLALLDAWVGWRGEDLVPSVAAVKAEELGTALGFVSVFEVPSPDRAIFRLVGAWYDKVTEQNLIGKNFIDMVAEEHRATCSERMWNLVSVPCGAVNLTNLVQLSGWEVPIRSLSLPVGPNSPEKPMRLYNAVDILGEASPQFDDFLSQFKLSSELDWVDIGYGIPE